MLKRIALPLIATVACAGGAFKDQARDAMPSKQAISMGSPPSQPQASSTSGSSTIAQNSTAGDRSQFHDLTVAVAVVFNAPTAAFLDLLRHVVEDYDPTSCDATSCTWGPGSDPLSRVDYKLVVSRDADGVSFDWALSGAVKPGTNFIVFASGVATPGPQRNHGSGKFKIDFDEAANLAIFGDPAQDKQATGSMDVTAYSNVGPAKLEVNFMGARDDKQPTQRNNILYTYANDTTGGGDLDFAMHNTTTGDRFSVHSRWKNDGRGRADVAGLGSGYDISLSECWGPAPFIVTYFSSSLKIVVSPWGGPDSGAKTQCAYSPAAFSPKSP
ncbi:MAG: hypothetical protein E6J63_03245 [Deltaproteobacteria bacterium]|nr:MAG: hypothetical protein E6J63_03245 [Deltaproteobacteria bacterium]